MRKLFLFIALGFMAWGCEQKGGNNDGSSSSEFLDPDARVYINAAEGTKATFEGQLSPLDIVKQAEAMYCDWGELGIGDWQRDTVNVRLAVGSSWVIDSFLGTLVTEGIEGRDYIFTILDEYLYPTDTIAYIPNSVMEDAEIEIKLAFEQGNYEECYKLFENAFEFVPITGAEWRELKAQGLN